MRLLLGAALLFVPLLVFGKLADDVHEKDAIGFDAIVQHFAHGLSSPIFDATLKFVTNFGGPAAIIVIAAGLVLALLYNHRRRMASVVLFGVGGAALINTILKLIFVRDRPNLWDHLVVEHSYSFPSGHAMASSALAFSIMAILWSTRWRWLAVILGLAYVAIIGFSRIYLGVHYPSDVLAGWCASLAWVVIVKVAVERYRSRGSHKESTQATV